MGAQDQYNAVVRMMAEAELDEASWPEASRRIDVGGGLVGSHLCVLRGESPDNAEFLFGRLYKRGEAHPELERTYVENYMAIDERLPRYFEMPDGVFSHVNALVPESVRRQSATYNEFLTPTGGGNSVIVHLAGPEGLHIAWSLVRDGQPEDWSTDQIEWIRGLLPHVRHFVLVRRMLASADGIRVRSLLDLQLGGRVGAILLDRWGRIQDANDRARDMLRAKDGLGDHGGFLFPSRKADTSRLRRLLARVLPGADGEAEGGSMGIHRRSAPPLALYATPMSGAFSDFGPGSVAALIMVADPLDKLEVDETQFPALLGLTPMQSRVAAFLTSGDTVQSISATLHLSPETVRWHIKQILGRLGLSRQADIIRLVLSTPGALKRR